MAAIIVGRIDPAVIEQREREHMEGERAAQERKMWKKHDASKYLKAKIKDGAGRHAFNGIKVRA